MNTRIFLLLWTGLATLSWPGCGQGTPPREDMIASLRARYLLTSEPDGVVSIPEARQQLAGRPGSVAIVGRIGGSDQPWDAGRAAFMVADPAAAAAASVHAHDGQHDPDSCPFCRQRAAAEHQHVAIVHFQDASGQILPFDARELFDLDAEQMVVVTGPGLVDALGNLVIAAEGMYVRR